MKVCIVGLGAIGGLIAGWLGTRLPAPQAATLQLSALARGETLAAVQRHGLRLDTAEGSVAVPLRASDDAAALGPQDLVVVAVKGPALAAVAPAVAALCGPRTAVLAAMNGVPWWFFEQLPGPARAWRWSRSTPAARCAAASRPNASSAAWCICPVPSSRPAGCAMSTARA